MRLLLAFACLLYSNISFTQSATYTVDFTNHHSNIAIVTGEFSGFPSLNLSMFVHPAEGLPQGEAGLIQNLQAVNEKGQPLAVKYDDMGEWKVIGNRTDAFSISYDVQLTHGEHAWFEAGGVDEVGYQTTDGFFATGYSLFLFPAIDDLTIAKEVKVSFVLPESWRASTPWTPTGKGTFRVLPDIRFLLNNCLFVGTHMEETVEIDGFQLRMAYGNDLYASRQQFTDLMRSGLTEIRDIFGGTLVSNYLIVINRHHMTDGSAFRGSFSQIINGEVSGESRVTWGHTMLHETIHLWNGMALSPAGQEEWFKEGFTDYLTMLVESKTGINTPEVVMKRLEKMYSRYMIGKVIQRAPESLQQAGNRKQEIRSLVYGGGALFALALDIEMREATHNRAGVTNLMKALFQEYALNGKSYTHSDVQAMASQLAGKPLDAFFAHYLHHSGFTDFQDYFERIGLNAFPFAEELYLSESSTAINEQKAIRQAIFGW